MNGWRFINGFMLLFLRVFIVFFVLCVRNMEGSIDVIFMGMKVVVICR